MSLLSEELVTRTLDHYEKFSKESFVVSPSLPVLYFGDLERYLKSPLKVVTVGKNPSDNEFRHSKTEPYSFFRFSKWEVSKKNLIEALNYYFEDKEPLKQWFSSFEPILNGLNCSFYSKKDKPNIAIHTDICSPLATSPTWSKLLPEERDKLFKEGNKIWFALIEELQPDIMLVSIPELLFKFFFTSEGKELYSFDDKLDGTKRKKDYKVYEYPYKLKSGKEVKIIFGQAANKPFDTISDKQKIKIGQLCLR